MLIKKEAGTKRRKSKKNIYKFIPREEYSITSHIMFVPPALMHFQVAAGKGLVISSDTAEEQTINGTKVTIIPLYRWLLSPG